MAHDYAKQRGGNKNNGKRKSNRAVTPKGQPSDSPRWRWFFSGLLCGAFATFVIDLALVRMGQDDGGLTETPGGAPVADATDDTDSDFDFFQYLPEAEVLVDVIPVEDTPRNDPDDTTRYLLQAGSFQDRQDAESRRAEIILMNMQANVVPGQVAGKTWHRVQVGPFTGRAAAEDARDALSSSNIDTIVLRMK